MHYYSQYLAFNSIPLTVELSTGTTSASLAAKSELVGDQTLDLARVATSLGAIAHSLDLSISYFLVILQSLW